MPCHLSWTQFPPRCRRAAAALPPRCRRAAAALTKPMALQRATTAIGLALCLNVAPRVALAQLAIPAPITPPNPGGVVAIQPIVPGGTLQPIQPTTSPNTDNQTSITASAVTAPAVMAQIEAGRLTPEKAWDTGALKVTDLLYILDRYVSEWGFISGSDQVELRRDLVKLLVEHGGDALTKPAALPAKARLWLADYFMSIGDPRAVIMGESILSEVKAPVGNEDALVFQTMERMAEYYKAKGEFDKGVQTWLRMKDYYTSESRFVPDALVAAARLKTQAGDFKQAQALYALVAPYGNGLYSGLALFDQAQQFIGQGNHAAARELLTQPVTGAGAEQAHIALLALLGSSYYATGDFELARRFSQEAVTRFEALPPAQQDNDLGKPVNMARGTLQSVEQWTKEPIICKPRELRLVAAPDRKSPLIQRLAVRTFHDIPLALSINTPLIKVHLSGQWGDTAVSHISTNVTKEVVVEITPEAWSKPLRATLVISSPQFPGFQAQVPVLLGTQDK